MAAALIAAGIDPARSILFSQAQVPAHAELAWLLNGTARIGWLNRMTQFKEKSGKNREGASIGLYAYPVLQAADVLLYQATHVPVGEDQKQHLELARDVATKFNTDFAVDLFTLPEPIIPPAAARIMSLARRHGQDVQVRPVGHEPDQPRRRCRHDRRRRSARPRPIRSRCPTIRPSSTDRPEARNLVGIYAALADETPAQVLGALRRAGLRRVQAGARRSAGRDARPDQGAARRAARPIRPSSTGCSRPAPRAPARPAAPTLAGAYRALGLRD